MSLGQVSRRTIMKLMGTGLMSTGLGSSLLGCSPDTTGSTMEPGVGGVSRPDDVPGTDRMFARIEEIFSWGIRRPGYPADRKAEDYIAEQFAALGLEKVGREPVPFARWEPIEYSLRVFGHGQELEIDCFPLPHSAENVDLELELALFDEDRPQAVAGKASLHPCPLLEMPATLPAVGGEALEAFQKLMQMEIKPEGTVVDPGGTLEETTHLLPFSGNIHGVMEPSQAAGAKAFIGIGQGHPGDICEYYVPYDGKKRDFPGVWIRESDGQRLKELLADGPVTIKLSVMATREPDISYNIVGELPGADDDILLIGSHHDGPWSSAVEDASGIALVLAQAEYWSKVPASERPHRMKFLLQAGHMAGSTGARAYVRAHPAEMNQIVLEVHLEHTANELRAGENGPELTGECEPRWFFTSRNPALEKSVIDALLGEGLDRSLVLAPDVLGPAPTTDGAIYHAVGVPIVNFLTAPVYLFDPMDTPDKIHKPSLEGITKATIRILQDTSGVSAEVMRAGITDEKS